MSFDFLYSLLPRPTLRPRDLIYKRRVGKSEKSAESSALAAEQKEESGADEVKNNESFSEALGQARRKINEVV